MRSSARLLLVTAFLATSATPALAGKAPKAPGTRGRFLTALLGPKTSPRPPKAASESSKATLGRTKVESAKAGRRAEARAATGARPAQLEVKETLGGKKIVLGVTKSAPGAGWRGPHDIFVARHPAVKRGIREVRRFHARTLAAASRRGAGGDASRVIQVTGAEVRGVWNGSQRSEQIVLDIMGFGRRSDATKGEAFLEPSGKLIRIEWRDTPFTGYRQAEIDVHAAKNDRANPLNRPPHTRVNAAGAAKFGETPTALVKGMASLRAGGARTITRVATHHQGWTVTYQTIEGGKTETKSALVGFDGSVGGRMANGDEDWDD